MEIMKHNNETREVFRILHSVYYNMVFADEWGACKVLREIVAKISGNSHFFNDIRLEYGDYW